MKGLKVPSACRVLLALGLGLLLGTARAATVTASPGACTSVNAGGQDWSNAANALSDNGAYAQAETDEGDATDYLRCTNYGFSIPATATINGVTVSVERRSSSEGNGGSRDEAVRLVKGGVIQGTDRSTNTKYTTVDVVEAHGAADDLWGTTWAPADINATTFGAAFRAVKQSSGGSSHRIYVDHIRITIDYTDAAPPSGDCTATASPTSCVNVGGIGTLAWSNASRARTSDNSRASASTWLFGSGTFATNYLQCTGFGFTLPSNGTINGITVDVERRYGTWFGTVSARDNAVRLVKNGVIGAADGSLGGNYPTSDAYAAHAGPGVLWGTTWTPADINAANFGAALSSAINVTWALAAWVDVDHLRITVSCSVPSAATPAAFNAYDTATAPADAVTGVLTTKVAGLPFDFDIAALDSSRTALLTTYAQEVKVELLDASAGGALDGNNCNATWPVIQTLPSQTFTGNGAGPGKDRTITGSGGRHRITGVTVANAWPNVAVRISYPSAGTPSVVGCSTDHFAIRPQQFSGFAVTDSDWDSPGTTRNLTNTAATGGTVHKAGQPFTVRATAVNGASVTTTNYVGTPVGVLGPCAGTACPAALGTFSAGSPAVAGVIDSDTAVYGEVGAFSLELQDQSFASVDNNDGSPATCAGRYICSGSVDVGRFVPDHFAVTAREIINRADLPPPAGTTLTTAAVAGDTSLAVFSLTGFAVGSRVRIPGGGAGGDSLVATVTAAASSTLTLDAPLLSDLALGAGVFGEPGFTYMGERMDASFTLVAEAADGSTTANYDGVLAKLNPTAAGNPLGLAVVNSGPPRTLFPACGGTPAFPCFTQPAATTGTFAAGVATDVTVPLRIHRGGTPVGPCATLDVGIAPTDADSVAMQGFDLDADAVSGNDHATVGRTQVRYGRMRLGAGYGSELVPLPISATVQSWANAASCANPCTCTSGSFVTSTTDSQTSFAASDVAFTNYRGTLAAGDVGVVTPPASVVFVNGVGGFTLSAPGAGESGSVDLTTNVPDYLPSNPARAVFGTYKSRLIYRRENY